MRLVEATHLPVGAKVEADPESARPGVILREAGAGFSLGWQKSPSSDYEAKAESNASRRQARYHFTVDCGMCRRGNLSPARS